jgi:hypothetical protein
MATHEVIRYNHVEAAGEWPMYKDAFIAKHTIVRNGVGRAIGATVGYLAKSKADGRWRFALASGNGWLGDGLGSGTDLFRALRAGAGYASVKAALRSAFPVGSWN